MPIWLAPDLGAVLKVLGDNGNPAALIARVVMRICWLVARMATGVLFPLDVS
jgi:hypothetical protein